MSSLAATAGGSGEVRLGRWRHAAAVAVYILLSAGLIGGGASISQTIFGSGSDPLQFVWFLAWFPWAILHHQSLLYTHLLWQPLGVSLLWVTSAPLPSLLMMPVTLLAGPVIAYNLSLLAAPVLSAAAAYFLCLRVSGHPLAAWFGGYVFGFSSFEMAADLATPSLSLSFLLPCLALLGWERLQGRCGRRRAVFFAAGILVMQFFISVELFATMMVFGAGASALAYRICAEFRPALRSIFVDGLAAGACAFVLLLPFLAEMFAQLHYLNLPSLWPFFFVADPVNFVVPTALNLFGNRWIQKIATHFPGILQEQDAYIGLPLLAILLLFGAQARRRPGRVFLAVLLAVFALLSLGPRLWLAGRYVGIILPWALFMHVPLLSSALPTRFALFVSLISAIILSLWVADSPRAFRLALALMACLALLPAPHERMKLPDARFFAPGRVQAVLGPDPRLLVLPFGPNGPSIYWQEENRFGFEQSGGYLGFPPAAMQHYKAVGALFGQYETADFGGDLRAFCEGTGTQYVVAGPGTSAALLKAFGALGWVRRQVDDVVIFTVPAHG